MEILVAENTKVDPVEAWIAANKPKPRIEPGNNNWTVQVVRIGAELPKGQRSRSGKFGAIVYVRRDIEPDTIRPLYCQHLYLGSLKEGGFYKIAACLINRTADAAFLYRSTAENPENRLSRRPTHKVDSPPKPCEAFEIPALTGNEVLAGGDPKDFSFRSPTRKKPRTP